MDYSEFSEKVIITHKLASAYGWDYFQIWGSEDGSVKGCPYPILKDIIKLLDMLEKDQNAFVNINEAGHYKNLLRLHPPKKD